MGNAEPLDGAPASCVRIPPEHSESEHLITSSTDP